MYLRPNSGSLNPNSLNPMATHTFPKSFALGFLAVSALASNPAFGDFGIFEWGINQNGIITGLGDPLPAGSSFDTTTGLGTIELVFTGTGLHSGILYVDHEISESLNTFFNELGTAFGAPGPGQSWEIDEPGFSSDPGDIYDNFLLDTLDGTVGKSSKDDVSMALGFAFVLSAGETAKISFLLSETPPSGGFYLRKIEPDSLENLYFSGTLSIRGTPVIPEGHTLLGGGALALLALAGAWKRGTRSGKD